MAGKGNYARVILLFLAGLAGVAWASACGDAAVEPASPDPPQPTTLTVTPATVELSALGATVQFSAEVRDQNGQVMSGASVRWTSSDASVASVDPTGLATAAGNGGATITAGVGTVVGTATVTVVQDVRTVTVSPAVGSVAPGASLYLSAVALDANGHRVRDSPTFVWSSSNVDVARASELGLVTGVAAGQATITAATADAAGSSQIRVATADRAALVALYEATDGPNWSNNENWLTNAPLEDWYGVSTDGSDRVVALELGGHRDEEAGRWVPHGLKGQIPPAIGALSSLRKLVLRVNDLSGPLPHEIGNLANLTHVDLWDNALSGPLPAQIGRLSNLTYLNLADNGLSGPLPHEIGSLSRLTRLNLWRNRLSGPVPAEIGSLLDLEYLSLGRNALSGPLPQSFLELTRLNRLVLSRNDRLCVPGTSAFAAWLAGIEDRDASFCNVDDMAVLAALYDATGGPAWLESGGWREGGAVERWHGVSTDSLGRVTALDLTRNGLSGRLPPNLGLLTELTLLRVGGNALSGRLPSSLAGLGLDELDYSGTGLCVPSQAGFRAWLSAIPSHQGTGVDCAPPSDREVLELFYAATNGPSWTNNDNWMTEAPLGDWHGVDTDDQGRVTGLRLRENNLKGGPLLVELGDLSSLTSLNLSYNELSGPLPPEIGNLSNLTWLGLSGNELSGTIPPEIGGLPNLRALYLRENDLSGPVPPEVGNLSSLRVLELQDNALSGAVPAKIGNLSSLKRLDLRDNALSDPVPRSFLQLTQLDRLALSGNELLCVPGSSAFAAWLEVIEERDVLACNASDVAALRSFYDGTAGPSWIESGGWLGGGAVEQWHGVSADSLGHVTELDLTRNGLSGKLPSSLGHLARMTRLRIGGNGALSGALPSSLAGLGLTEFAYSQTELCIPTEPEFHEWLNAIPSHEGTGITCAPLSDRDILESFYDATGGPNWGNNDNWGTDAPLADWFGVDTDDDGRVTGLRLRRNHLKGRLPLELGDLSRLNLLDLRDNSVSGSLPPEIGDLSNLTALDLGYNAFSGSLPPEIGNLSNLAVLNLWGNALSGPLPPEIGNLSGLTELDVWGNTLSGLVPRSFLQLAQLDRLALTGNELLCVPGSAPFAAWLDGIEERDVLACNASDVGVLAALYDATGGPSWPESGGWLGEGAVEQWHGVTADSLGRVTGLDLTRNGLSGRLPATLGRLARITRLRLGDNQLSGPLPSSLAGLGLVELHYSDTALCVPPEAAFHEWLNTIASHEGTALECLSDREILEILYEATDGRNWSSSTNWLTSAPLEDWHGLAVDGHGRVVRMELREMGLAGPIPPELGELAHLSSLDLRHNGLAGTIPPELGTLANLELLNLRDNTLSGSIPPELGTLAKLESLSLRNNDLSGRIPPELGDLTNLRILELGRNNLTRSIPREVGNLTNLRTLSIPANDLKGHIPAELGSLANLERLILSENALSGSIPPTIGNLKALTSLDLSQNSLTGSIPATLGGLTRLRSLILSLNALTGSVPRKLGSLDDLRRLELNGNRLSGPIPPELVDLSALESLVLSANRLTGSVPPGFGDLKRLRTLILAANADLSGNLPASMTSLMDLETLQAGGTDLCAPSDADFLEWLQGVPNRRVARCDGEASVAYLVQAVQSRQFPVPLVAGEPALLRVFPTANQATSRGLPPVEARFYVDGREAHVARIAGTSVPIPTEVDEGSLSQSANAVIPAHVVRPGLEMVIDVDPNGTLDSGLGVVGRIPETGRLTLDVRALPPFELTLIPFIWSERPDRSIVDLTRDMAANPDSHELLAETRTLLPIADQRVAAHEPVATSTNNGHTLLRETIAIRTIEGGTGYYMGMMAGPITGRIGGVASPSNWSNFSIPDSYVIAHELGHNLSLPHAPCGGALGPDPAFPYPDGSIGTWGYNFRDGGRLVSPHTSDLMSYCRNQGYWISDFFFNKALGFRLREEQRAAQPDRAAVTRSLLLWGSLDADGVPFLEPAFVVDAPPSLPGSSGDYRLTGRTRAGAELFSFSFAIAETFDGDGTSGFAFALPVQSGWEDDFVEVTLSGPGGSATLDPATDRPVAILRDAQTGRVRGVLRAAPPATQAAMDAAGDATGPRLEVLFSRGIPDAAAWRR